MSKDRLCVALDGLSRSEAKDLLREVKDYVGWAKVGMELFTAVGPAMIDEVKERNMKVFLDLKFHDIPNTVKKAVTRACEWGVDLVNVHASGGFAMLQAACEGAAAHPQPIQVIAVTVLTSLSDAELREIGVMQPASEHAYNLAALSNLAGLDGVVCSPLEVEKIREEWSGAFIVTPGIRMVDQDADDQKRISTPKAALDAGSNLLVIGRAITQAPMPRKAAEQIRESIRTGN